MSGSVADDAAAIRAGRKPRLDVSLKGFNPVGEYNGLKFAGTYYNHRKLLRRNKRVQDKEIPEPEAIKELAKILYGDPNYYAKMYDMNVSKIKEDGDMRVKEFDDKFTMWAYNNRRTLLSELKSRDAKRKPEEKMIPKIAMQVKLFNTRGEDRNHDQLVGEIGRFKKLEEIASEEDPGKRQQGMLGEIEKEVKRGRVSSTTQHLMLYSGGRHIQEIYNAIRKEQMEVVGGLLTEERAEKLLTKCVDIAESAFENSDWDEGDRVDMRRASLAPLLRNVADGVYSEEDAKKTEKEYVESDKERRKQNAENDAKEMGLFGW